MGYITAIEWTDHTFNPWWGCTKVSAGCDFCYAEAWADRFGHNVWGKGNSRRLMGENYWLEPLKWNAEAERSGRRARVFCASMADVFEEEAPQSEVERLWQLIRRTPFLDWQLLTKRPHRIARSLPKDWGAWGYPNVWLGTSVEDSRVVKRISMLVAVPAAVHFLSLEPLIGPLPNLQLENIEWVIVGGESGSTPREIKKEWVLDIKKQCDDAQVAFFFKQWGGVKKKTNGRSLNGRIYGALPEINISPDWLQNRKDTITQEAPQRQRRTTLIA